MIDPIHPALVVDVQAHRDAAESDILAALRAASIERQAEWGASLPPLPAAFKAIELGGEVGEALNIVKKLERERLGWTGSRATIEDLANELADVVICVDLLAREFDIELGPAIIKKFNATSQSRGLKTKIAAAIRERAAAGEKPVDWRARALAAEARAERLAEALRPFATKIRVHDAWPDGSLWASSVSCGEVRRAAQALADQEAEKARAGAPQPAEALRAPAQPEVAGERCPACPVEARDLGATAYNALIALEAARQGQGSWDRAWRKLTALRGSLERWQPIVDAHFAGHPAPTSEGSEP